MVARSATEASGFSPVGLPRVVISGDGTLAAIAEPTRAVVLELPGGVPFAEVGIDPHAAASEIAWVGAIPRLLVLSRFAAHSTVHLIDPHGPRTIAEIRLESPMKLYGSVGAHALAVGAMGAAVLTATDTHLTPYQFPARAVPVTAGAAGGNFFVALSGSIEEWDPQSRMPKRRLRLQQPAVISAVGGSDRVIWMMMQNEPTRIEVIPLVNRGQPKMHELPEPIAQVAGHPRSDVIACVGAESGKLYVIDLDGRKRLRTLATDTLDHPTAAGLVVGRVFGVIAAQAGRPIVFVPIDGREPEVDTQVGPVPAGLRPEPEPQPEPEPKKSTLGIDDEDEPPVVPAPAPVRDVVAIAPPAPPPIARPPVAQRPPPPPAAPPPPQEPTPSLAEHFRASRERERERLARARPLVAMAPALVDAPTSWREDLVTWARAVAAGQVDRGAPPAAALDTLVTRFDLDPSLVPALALLYGSHLSGERGAAPFDVARVLGRQWAEALGTGQLAARGLARYSDSRVQLAVPIQRALDELPVATGTMVGEPSTVTLLGPCVVVSADTPLRLLALRHLAAVGGAILAAHDDVEPADLFVEARARGAAPMLRIAAGDLLSLGTDPAVLVVADDAAADELQIPRL